MNSYGIATGRGTKPVQPRQRWKYWRLTYTSVSSRDYDVTAFPTGTEQYLRSERKNKEIAMNSVWLGDEVVTVEAHFLPDGKVQPIAFIWRGRRWSVTGVGRQWDDADGKHVLVVSDGSRFELCLTSVQGNWRLLRAWERPHLV